MQLVEPKVFLIGETRLISEGLEAFLGHLGVSGWKSNDWTSDSPTDIEKLIEVSGRLCYRSFGTGLNPNLTRVRPENKEYLLNLMRTKHGSVLEHGFVNFIFADVSRVFTHELVRHRVGTSISQESLRFVRLNNLRVWVPRAIRENAEAMQIFMQNVKSGEELQLKLAQVLDVDGQPNFHKKKYLTSAMRRLAPDGMATNISWGANIRTLRHLIQLRTDPGAEEEIRLVFGQVAEIVIARYPNLFGDFTKSVGDDGVANYTTAYEKV